MRGLMCLLLGCLLMAAPARAEDEKKSQPDGTVKFTSGSAGIVVGYRWGSGTLTFQGKDHPFSIEGMEVGEVGGSEATVAGEVYGLRSLQDFDGTYTSASANLTLGKGGGGWHLVNENGVRLELSRSTVGLKLTIGFDGMKVKLKE